MKSPESGVELKNKNNLKSYFKKIKSIHLRNIDLGGLTPFEQLDKEMNKVFDRNHLD